MKISRVLTFPGLAMAAMVCMQTAYAQGPLYDKVIVDLPYPVSVNKTTLPAGHYVIREFDDQGTKSHILQIYSDQGMKLESTVMTIPALDLKTPEKTSVILHHYGDDYFFDKVWVQGKNYGYEFPLPSSVKSRQKEKMSPYTVAARYEGPSSEPVAQATPPPAPVAAPAPQVEAPAPAPSPVTAAPAPAPAPVPAPETDRMPTTADGWAMSVTAGGLLALAGLLLYRRIA